MFEDVWANEGGFRIKFEQVNSNGSVIITIYSVDGAFQCRASLEAYRWRRILEKLPKQEQTHEDSNDS